MDGSTQDDNPLATAKAANATIARGLPRPVAEMTAEEKVHADGIDLRCLSLSIGMLERVNGVRTIFLTILSEGLTSSFYCVWAYSRHLRRTRRLKGSLQI